MIRKLFAYSLSFVVLVALTANPARAWLDPVGTVHAFTVPGEHEYSGLIVVGSTLVGATSANVTDSTPPPFGRAFSMNLDGSNYQATHVFNGPEGANPVAALTLVGSTIYGTTSGPRAGQPSTGNAGTVFSMNTDGSNYQVLRAFAGTPLDPGNLQGSLIAVGSRLYGTEAGNNGVIFAINQDGSNFQAVHTFSGSDGASPAAGLTAVGGVLYGTASAGGSAGDGVVFSVNQDGSNYQVLHTFTGERLDGSEPVSSLLQVGSRLYGTTESGGTINDGAIFSMNLDGTNYKVLHSFASSDGSRPQAGLIAVGSVLYGTAENKVFSLNADGSNFQVIATVADSKAPLLAVGSMLYGTTVGSAAPGQATVFAIAIPEPSSIMLAALGIVSLMAYGWRRKRA